MCVYVYGICSLYDSIDDNASCHPRIRTHGMAIISHNRGTQCYNIINKMMDVKRYVKTVKKYYVGNRKNIVQ